MFQFDSQSRIKLISQREGIQAGGILSQGRISLFLLFRPSTDEAHHIKEGNLFFQSTDLDVILLVSCLLALKSISPLFLCSVSLGTTFPMPPHSLVSSEVIAGD